MILKKQNIDYTIDFEMPNSLTDFARFYFDKRDEKLVNQLLIENEIDATDDFFVPADYKKEQKTFHLYLKFAGILLLFLFISKDIFASTIFPNFLAMADVSIE